MRTTILATGPEDEISPRRPPEYAFRSAISIRFLSYIKGFEDVKKKTPWGGAQGERGVIMRSCKLSYAAVTARASGVGRCRRYCCFALLPHNDCIQYYIPERLSTEKYSSSHSFCVNKGLTI